MTDLIDLAPIAQLLLVGALLAALALLPLLYRHRHAPTRTRLRALTALTLFLTFDLVLFGAFTRLTDSGLGCPDWPGCYGEASPHHAHAEISQAQAESPTGPVTHRKAWIEMIHRYLATGVGALITVLMFWTLYAAWQARRSQPKPEGRGTPSLAGLSPGWAVLTFFWVCVQGAFGALTVTLKLYPLIVTLHLLGGIGLLVLLAVQAERYRAEPWVVSPALRAGLWAVSALVLLQIALGGWVSTNYAVLACSDFPTCQGGWWPEADYANGFTLLRPLAYAADGSALPFAALVAIHWTHRMMAVVVLAAMSLLAAALWRQADPRARRAARGIALLAAWQAASGLSNVVLGWPLLAAVAHTGGAAALAALMGSLLARASSQPSSRTSH